MAASVCRLSVSLSLSLSLSLSRTCACVAFAEHHSHSFSFSVLPRSYSYSYVSLSRSSCGYYSAWSYFSGYRAQLHAHEVPRQSLLLCSHTPHIITRHLTRKNSSAATTIFTANKNTRNKNKKTAPTKIPHKFQPVRGMKDMFRYSCRFFAHLERVASSIARLYGYEEISLFMLRFVCVCACACVCELLCVCECRGSRIDWTLH